jgi:hypothetical protein
MKEVIYIEIETALLFIMAAFAFATLVLKIVEVARGK